MRVRASAPQKGGGARSDRRRESERAREREKKKRRPVVHTVFTHVCMCVRARVCLRIVMCACVEACHERDIFSRSHSTRERDASRSWKRAARPPEVVARCPSREREKERGSEEGGKS